MNGGPCPEGGVKVLLATRITEHTSELATEAAVADHRLG